MNSHLNIFKTYTRTNRSYQLENDLTRSLAICLQEDSLFFHEVLKEIFVNPKYYNRLFEALESETQMRVEIQERTSQLAEFEHIFAVSLSESELSDFWEQSYDRNYDPVCDLVIWINDILIVFEAKRDHVDCTAQLYNQVYNIVKSSAFTEDFTKENYQNLVTPFDLNWPKLMAIAVKVSSFEKSMGMENRFLSDFIELVRDHNFRWLPEPSISALNGDNTDPIKRRIGSSIEELTKNNPDINKLEYHDRQGIEFPLPWAQEILFSIHETGELRASIYPGNTKGQGYHLFNNDPEFNTEIEILNEKYPVSISYHIKFTSYQKFFAGLWFREESLKKPLYTSENFHRYTGRKKRGEQWDQIEQLFDSCLNFDWKNTPKCNWQAIIDSGKNQFDMSFGYEIFIAIPFRKLQEIDTDQSNIDGLVKMLGDINTAFQTQLYKSLV